MLKAALKSVPLIGPLIRKVRGPKLIESSADYWESRYASGGTSGAGSYNRLASFKAEFINAYVSKHAITRVLEFGSGDCVNWPWPAIPNMLAWTFHRPSSPRPEIGTIRN